MSIQKKIGFTLLELMVVLALISILCCIGYPLLKNIQSREISNVSNDLTRMLQFARLESVLRHETLVLKPIFSNNWIQGAALFTTSNANNTKPIHQFHWTYHFDQLIWRGFESRDVLVIAPDLNHLAMNGYFELIDQQKILKKITVSRFGVIR